MGHSVRIEVLKIFRGFENVDPNRFFQVVGNGVRRDNMNKYRLFESSSLQTGYCGTTYLAKKVLC